MKTASSTTNLIACAVIVGAVTAGFATGPAFAQPEATTPFEFKFDFAPSELTSATAAEKLLARLESDVRAHCDTGGKKSISERRLVSQCIDTTMKASIAKFGSATLAQAFNARADG